jgi:hypothetical protein
VTSAATQCDDGGGVARPWRRRDVMTAATRDDGGFATTAVACRDDGGDVT